MNKKQRTTFQRIPFTNLIEKIQYKADEYGINVLFTEESYTSQASFLDNDELPIYNKNDKSEKIFSGVRINRGLYRSKNGVILNADINGSANIARKISDNEQVLFGIGKSLSVRPLVVNLLKLNAPHSKQVTKHQSDLISVID